MSRLSFQLSSGHRLGYESHAVYDFCRTRYHRRVFAVKGQGGPHPVWPKKPTAKNIRGERPWIVGTD